MEPTKTAVFATAVRGLMRPIVALLLRNGVMYQQFARWCKAVYVEVAARDFGKRGRPTNQSRIALLTGLDRKEVKRLRDAQTKAQRKPAARPVTPDRLGRVLTAWHRDERFARDGQPRALRVDDEFSDLCRDYGGDVPDTAILKELVAGGAVRQVTRDTVVAARRYYMPEPADPSAVLRAADVYTDIGQTLLHNLYRGDDEPSRFEGRATNLRVGTRYADEFRAFLEERGQAFLEEVDAWLEDKERQTRDDEDRLRLGLGLYWLQGAPEDDDDE